MSIGFIIFENKEEGKKVLLTNKGKLPKKY